MKEVEVVIASDTTCLEALYSNSDLYINSNISEIMLCTGPKGKDSCSADSGGPFTVKNADNQHELVGVVSWGRSCALVSLSHLIHHCSQLFVQGSLFGVSIYGVYSEVGKLRTWINRTFSENGGATFVPI